jgi:predicted  nucleic acid-binding Zn-ribbon protein
MSTAEQEAIWDRLEKHGDLISGMRADHVQLSTDVKNLTSLVRARAQKAEEQHKEIISSIKELTTAENERAGMAKLGRGVAVVVGSLAAAVGIAMTFFSGRPAP